MMILSRIVASFQTHTVVRRPGSRGGVWKISCSGRTHCAPAKAAALEGMAAITFEKHEWCSRKIDHVY
jgi:hypothetical protein